ncbi:MAG: glutathione peroxidase [Archangiaceae bacterium]|nr:glutathione peroxidase [Archangiaceae bacterium]
MISALLTLAVLTAPEKKEPAMVYDFTVKSIDGKDVPLSTYRGKALLIVNTASECGYTPQYEGLQKLYEQYQARGFEILAFPSNDFGGQEPGSNADVKKLCTLKYKTTFPLFAKVAVKGSSPDPLYQFLQGQKKNGGAVKWNFSKFLVDAKGEVVAHYESGVEPQSAELKKAVEAALPAK